MGSNPVARVWRAIADRDQAPEYVRFFDENVRPALASIDGHQAAHLLRRETSDGVEFLAVTIWDSMEVVAEFAGADCERAVVEPEAQAMLTEFDRTVVHYDVV